MSDPRRHHHVKRLVPKLNITIDLERRRKLRDLQGIALTFINAYREPTDNNDLIDLVPISTTMSDGDAMNNGTNFTLNFMDTNVPTTYTATIPPYIFSIDLQEEEDTRVSSSSEATEASEVNNGNESDEDNVADVEVNEDEDEEEDEEVNEEHISYSNDSFSGHFSTSSETTSSGDSLLDDDNSISVSEYLQRLNEIDDGLNEALEVEEEEIEDGEIETDEYNEIEEEDEDEYENYEDYYDEDDIPTGPALEPERNMAVGIDMSMPNHDASIRERLTCIFCQDNMKSVIFLPCAHICACIECSKKLQSKRCPVCRGNIDVIRNVYF